MDFYQLEAKLSEVLAWHRRAVYEDINAAATGTRWDWKNAEEAEERFEQELENFKKMLGGAA